jgi:hypothetical protein
MTTLTIKSEEFKAILSGQKKRDYRDPSLFNKRKLLKKNSAGQFDRNTEIKEIKFLNGFKKDAPFVIMEVVEIVPVHFINAYTNTADCFTCQAGVDQIEITLGQILTKGGNHGKE